MKKSNKLILGGFLTIVLLIAGVHIALYAKYKNGDYTIYNPPAPPKQTFRDIKFVSVYNVYNTTADFSDVAQMNKEVPDDISYVQKGDTLIITGKAREYLQSPGSRWNAMITLPYNVILKLTNSSLSFTPGKNNAGNNPVIYLQRSQAFFMGMKNEFQFGNMKIIATDSSAAMFQGNTTIDKLEVELNNSSIDYMNGNFEQLFILTDSISRVSLQTKHLLKANIRTIYQ